MSRVLIPLAQGFEELEAITVVDLLRRAGIEVITAASSPGRFGPVGGWSWFPTPSWTAWSGSASTWWCSWGKGRGGASRADSRIRELLVSMNQAGGYLAAICAAPRVLAEAHVLVGRRATGFPGALDDLPEGA